MKTIIVSTKIGNNLLKSVDTILLDDRLSITNYIKEKYHFLRLLNPTLSCEITAHDTSTGDVLVWGDKQEEAEWFRNNPIKREGE
ncbi:MAG: hypothetical protein J6I69_02295 [Bacilli bacterium]|nr:hypothetical protein [Bacilli bacterium]